jgi:hypothetical protein
MKKIMILITCLFAMLFSQDKAITEDGKTVLLKNDGTWEYEIIDDKNTEEEEPDFRKSHWGDSYGEVVESEQLDIFTEADRSGIKILAYKTDVSGLNATMVYLFAADKLYSAKYIFTEDHTYDNDYINDYKTIQKILTNKYGTPAEDETLWRNSLYQDDPEKYGFALAYGHLVYYSSWNLEKTEISLFINGDNFEVSHSLEYLSKEFENLSDKAKKNSQGGVF